MKIKKKINERTPSGEAEEIRKERIQRNADQFELEYWI